MQDQRTPLRPIVFVVLIFLVANLAAQPQTAQSSTPKYRDPQLSSEDRVADLLRRMTLEEKVEQISGGCQRDVQVIDPTGTFTTEQSRDVLKKWSDPDLVFPARKAAILRNGVQRYLREKTRLGIPALFMGEALHGFMEYGSTSFPQALGLASTWDAELVHQVFTAAGDEARSAGVGQVFSPCSTSLATRAGAAPKKPMARPPTWRRASVSPRLPGCRAIRS